MNLAEGYQKHGTMIIIRLKYGTFKVAKGFMESTVGLTSSGALARAADPGFTTRSSEPKLHYFRQGKH